MSTVHVWWCKAPEVQPLTQLYTIFTEKVPLSYIIKYTFHSKMLRFNSAFSFAIYIPIPFTWNVLFIKLKSQQYFSYH